MPAIILELFSSISFTVYITILIILFLYSALMTFANIIYHKENKAINEAYADLLEKHLDLQEKYDKNWREV